VTQNSMYDKLIAFLDENKAQYRLIDHAPEGRTEIVSPLRGNTLSQAAKCMVLLVQIGKKETKYVLGVIRGDQRIDFEAVKQVFSASYVSFAPAEVAEELSGSVVGTVLPFSFNERLELVVDPSLLDNEEFFFNAARLDRSIALSSQDFRRIVQPRLSAIGKESELKTEKNKEVSPLESLRHSCAHLLAAAIVELYPGVKRTIGPAIENGFYYDFDFGKVKVSESDFPHIEEKMHELAKTWKGFTSSVVTKEIAFEIFEDNEYKKELIEEFSKEDQKLTIYNSGTFEDLCRGGHCKDPSRQLKYFKLLSIAGAYWRGSEKNKMLTRIYGTCFPSQKDLDNHLHMLDEAKKRDHRKLGSELDLFVFSDLVGKGLPLWTPKGSIIRRELERFIVDEEIKRGYLHVYTPELARLDLYRTSGHYPYYKDTMYAPITIDEDEFMLRPMTCPHHFELYKSRPRSYRELPMRLAELAKLYRYEKSGELTGLMRVRSFCLADAHIVATRDQATDEINGVLDLIDYISGVFGLKSGVDYRYRLSLGDRGDDKKYFKDDASWIRAEEVLRQVLKDRKAEYYEAENEAAFYGPKIDVQIKNIAGKEETAFTVQYDFVMPKRFSLVYIDTEGKEQEPIVIHRSSVGAIERTMAFLIEHYGGAFPTWLNPVQVKILPITERNNQYAQSVLSELKQNNLRTELDGRSETLQAKIRDAQIEKSSYMLIIGDKEQEAGTVTVRARSGKNLGACTPQQFMGDIRKEIEEKRIV
jgi:threonyl-tRNA synthetase